MTALFTPSDSLIGPIVSQIAQIIETQIAGVDRVYPNIPDGPPEDNSVIIPLSNFEILDETNGRLSVRLTFGVRHLIRRKEMGESVTACYSYLMPYFQCFSAWKNQDLGGTARLMTVKNGGITQFIESGQVYLALIINLQVLTEFTIPVS